MENRDKIIARLIALKAKAECSSVTDAEAFAYMQKYNELMQQYMLTETDLGIKSSGIHQKTFSTSKGKHKSDMFFLVVPIGMVTETRPIYNVSTGETIFYGTQADVDYAEFLFRLIDNAMKQSWEAYRYSFDYTRLIRAKVHGRVIRNGFFISYIKRMNERLQELAFANHGRKTGTALIVLKNALIQQHLDESGAKISTGKEVVRKSFTAESAIHAGTTSAEKVHLQQQTEGTTQQITHQS